MKKKLNLTIEEDIRLEIKKKALEEDRPVSQIIEELIINYLKKK